MMGNKHVEKKGTHVFASISDFDIELTRDSFSVTPELTLRLTKLPVNSQYNDRQCWQIFRPDKQIVFQTGCPFTLN